MGQDRLGGSFHIQTTSGTCSSLLTAFEIQPYQICVKNTGKDARALSVYTIRPTLSTSRHQTAERRDFLIFNLDGVPSVDECNMDCNSNVLLASTFFSNPVSVSSTMDVRSRARIDQSLPVSRLGWGGVCSHLLKTSLVCGSDSFIQSGSGLDFLLVITETSPSHPT